MIKAPWVRWLIDTYSFRRHHRRRRRRRRRRWCNVELQVRLAGLITQLLIEHASPR